MNALEAEIEATRERLVDTIDQLVYRAHPKTIANRQVSSVKAYFVDAETGQTRWESDGVTEWGRSLDGTEGTSVVEGPQVEVEPVGEGTTSTRIRLTSARPGAEFRMELAEGEFSGVTVDGEPLSDDGSAGAQGLRTLRIVGVPAGHEVVIEAEVPDGASMEVVETVYSPALADGWVAPGSGVSLVQPRVEISRTVTL